MRGEGERLRGHLARFNSIEPRSRLRIVDFIRSFLCPSCSPGPSLPPPRPLPPRPGRPTLSLSSREAQVKRDGTTNEAARDVETLVWRAPEKQVENVPDGPDLSALLFSLGLPLFWNSFFCERPLRERERERERGESIT
jgi:hypothetical protein